MSTPPNFPAILATAIAGISIIGWLSEHNRAEEYWKELARGIGQQSSWTNRTQENGQEMVRE